MEKLLNLTDKIKDLKDNFFIINTDMTSQKNNIYMDLMLKPYTIFVKMDYLLNA